MIHKLSYLYVKLTRAVKYVTKLACLKSEMEGL